MGRSVTRLHIDFETRSPVNLKTTGVHVYAAPPDTDVWCMAWAFGDGEIGLWRRDDTAQPHELFDFIENDGIVVAHNAAFELAIWNHVMVPRYGWPPLDPRQVRCTMAMALAMSLPAGLDDAAAAVGLPIQKDQAGYRVMRQMAAPRTILANGTLVWWDDDVRREKLYAYCKQDIEVERQLEKRLLPLTEAEQALWVLDQEINNRGVHIDVPSVNKLLRAVDIEKERLDRRMLAMTEGRVRSCNQAAEITAWVEEQGVSIDGLAKAEVTELLDDPTLPPHVRAVLAVRKEAAKASTAKLRSMVAGVSEDQRARGLFQFHGAATGRWAGRRIQLQNLPRPSLEHEVIETILADLGGIR